MEQNKTDQSSFENEDLHPNSEATAKIEMEDCKGRHEKTDTTKINLSTADTSKRSSIDITVKKNRDEADDEILMYSAKQLSEIRESVASKEWPDFLEECFKNARGQWDPDRWHQNRKRGSTPPGDGDKLSERRDRDGYSSNATSERSNITKPLSGQDRPTGLSVDGNRKKLADPRERLKSENEGIVLSPQRRSFTTGCQVTQTTEKDDVQERGNQDKGRRQTEREVDGVRDRNRESREADNDVSFKELIARGEATRRQRSMHDRGLEKEDLSLNFRDPRRRDGANDEARRVGSGRIPTNRIDRDRGLDGEDYGINDRTRNDRYREQHQLERNNFNDNRDRAGTDRRGMAPNDRRDYGREDNRDISNNGRPRFNFQRERDHDDPRERLSRNTELNDVAFDRSRVRDIRGDWNDPKLKEYEQKRERVVNNQHSQQAIDRPNARFEKREERNLETDKGDQRFKANLQSNLQTNWQFADDNMKQDTGSYYNQRYQGSGYGRKDRGGSRYPRRSETEEPEWMSESVQMGELMELHGFDDSPDKESSSNISSAGKSTEKGQRNAMDKRLSSNRNKSGNLSDHGIAEKESMKQQDNSCISMDDIFHLDSIPGLANILADDSIDPSFMGNSVVNHNQLKDNIHHEGTNAEYRDGGSKFSQFFQPDSNQALNEGKVLLPNSNLEGIMKLRQDHIDFTGFPQSSNQEEIFSNGASMDSGRGNSMVTNSENAIAPTIRIPSPGNPSAYFAPISPAAKTSNIEQVTDSSASNNSLMDMLRLGSSSHNINDIEGNMHKGQIPPPLSQLRGNKNVKSVEELEADIKQMVGISSQENDLQEFGDEQKFIAVKPHEFEKQFKDQSYEIDYSKENDTQNQDMSAFKKFAALMEGKVATADDHKLQMNYKDNIRVGGNAMLEGIPPGVVKPSPMPLNAPTEETVMFQDRQHSRRALQANFEQHPNEHQTHIPHQLQMNQNGPELNRTNPSILQPLQHLPQPMPRAPHSIPPAFPIHDQGNFAMLQLISQAPFTPHLLEIPEAVTLQTALNNGQVAPSVLLNQFIHGNLPPIRREILLNVLKVAQNQGRLGQLPPGRVSPSHSNSLSQQNMTGNASQSFNSHLNIHSSSKQGARISPPMPHSPVPDPLQMLMQQQNQHPQPQQQRVSPMLLGVVPQAGSKNTLSVSPVPSQQRVPSPQELVLHTQQIMQNALIKRKLEEQKENYRRRQDYQSPNTFRERSNSDSKGAGNGNTCRDSPLAFTPMSVMKKMAADRRDSDPKVISSIPELKLSQATSGLSDTLVGPSGDIVQDFASQHGINKSEENSTNLDKVGQQFEDSQCLNNIFSDTRDNYPLDSTPASSGMLTSTSIPSRMSQAASSSNQFNQMHLQQAALQRAHQLNNQWAMSSTGAVSNNRPPPFPGLSPLEHQILMQQHGYGGPLPPNVVAAVSAAGASFQPSHQLPHIPTFQGGNQQQMAGAMMNSNPRPQQQLGMPSTMNAHATTSSFGAATQGNLAKFFSPEILAQAQSGNAPSMPPLPTQKALTLEEIERQAAAVRI